MMRNSRMVRNQGEVQCAGNCMLVLYNYIDVCMCLSLTACGLFLVKLPAKYPHTMRSTYCCVCLLCAVL